MTYEKLKSVMPANRRWCKWTSCLYLERYRSTIRIRYGYRYRCSYTIGIWYPSGTFKFPSTCYYPSQRFRLNYFMPDDYFICNHRYYSFLGRSIHPDYETRAFYIRSEQGEVNSGNRQGSLKDWIVITKNEVKNKLGPTLEEIKFKLKEEDRARDKPRRRGRYWLRKARGIFRKPCGKTYSEGCEWLRTWPRPTTNWTSSCGCRVYTKKAVSRDSVATIMEEKNATVRAAKIQVYGIEKFFTDAGAKTINKEAGYELLELNTGVAHRDDARWRRRWDPRQLTANLVLVALRMECSTTGKVYVNTVPPELRTVRAALDWIYNIEGYLERVGKQT